jgi:hypothetical protein
LEPSSRVTAAKTGCYSVARSSSVLDASSFHPAVPRCSSPSRSACSTSRGCRSIHPPKADAVHSVRCPQCCRMDRSLRHPGTNGWSFQETACESRRHCHC